MEYIQRHVSKIIKENFSNYPIVLITGARQVGKSYMLKHEFSHIKSVSLADPLIRKQATDDPQLFLKTMGIPLIIDEIQLVPSLFSELLFVIDKNSSDGQYILTGSQKYSLLKGISESLAGRVSIIEMSGLSLRELYNIPIYDPFLPNNDYLNLREQHKIEYQDVYKNIYFGSYPKIYHNGIENVETYYANYVKTYLEKDVRGFIQPQNETIFFNFLIAIAVRSGQKINYASISKDVGVSQVTIKEWISILEATNIVIQLNTYSDAVLKRVSKTPKIYFRDTGLLCYLAGWLTKEAMTRGNQFGSIFETFVVSEIVKSYENNGKEYHNRLFFYSGWDKDISKDDGLNQKVESEIDLIIDYNHCLYPIEIKKSSQPITSDASSFKVLNKITDKMVAKGTILCQASQLIYLRENLLALPIEYL